MRQLRQCDKKTRASHIESLMKDVGLTPFKDTKVSKLSNGFRRRVSVLVAFVGEPKVNTIQYTCIATTPWPVWLMLMFLFFADRVVFSDLLYTAWYDLQKVDLWLGHY